MGNRYIARYPGNVIRPVRDAGTLQNGQALQFVYCELSLKLNLLENLIDAGFFRMES